MSTSSNSKAGFQQDGASEEARLQQTHVTGLEQETAALKLSDQASKATTIIVAANKEELLPHRSHDPQLNQKRSDPFKFGSRYLTEGDNVFEFNAWDHVETDDSYKEYAEQQYAMQRGSPVSDFDKSRFNSNPAKWWDLFYRNNTANFFQNRKWLHQEFPVLDQVTQPDAGPVTILEIGAGAGNTAFPILSKNSNPKLKIHACDFAKKAVTVMRESDKYDEQYIQADVWDAAGEELPPGLEEESVDVAIMIFIFSALSPRQWTKAVDNVYRLLKPGGQVLFRDYGRGDLAQVRFKKGRYLEENFYIRGDGTRVYFFDQDELARIWNGNLPPSALDGGSCDEEKAIPAASLDGYSQSLSDEKTSVDKPRFTVENLGMDRRLLVNRAKKLKMYRCWLQGRFRKLPVDSPRPDSEENYASSAQPIP